MKCFECGGEYIDTTGDLVLENRIVGKYQLNGVNFKKCDNCGDLMLPGETWETADKEEERLKNDLLRKLPIGDFISAAETADILGITKQALNKHRRIKSGFIFFIRHSGIIQYLLKSVKQFKETQDGRFPLHQQNIIETGKRDTRYITIVSIPYTEDKYRDPETNKMPIMWKMPRSTNSSSTNI